MKKNLLFFFFILFLAYSKAQINLVANPSFEIYDTCPYTTIQVPFATGWKNYGNTPDYFNACATNYVSVPLNGFGYANAANGNAYCGFIPYSIADTNYRETIGTNLDSTLQIGQKYYISAKFRLASGTSFCIAINRLCVKFSTVEYSRYSPAPITNSAHLVSGSVIADTSGWYQLKGSFIADSAYTKIMIGNFFNNYLTDTLQLSFSPAYAYYVVDMICVSRDSSTCYTSSGEGIASNILINDKIKIGYDEDDIFLINPSNAIIKSFVTITDIIGRQVYAKQVVINEKEKIPIPFLNPSIYFITILTEKNSQTIKFIKK